MAMVEPELGVGDSREATAPSRVDGVLRALQAVLLVTGATLLTLFAVAQVDADRGREQALAAFAQARAEQAATPERHTATVAASATRLEYSNEPDQSLWGKARIAAYRESLTVHQGTPLGVIRIPGISLEVPIFEGTSELTLNRGIGRIEGTADLASAGNLGLAGHRDGFFRGLKDLQVGDAIEVESLAGRLQYRVTDLLIVEPSDVYVLAPTEAATLTLVTCYPFYFIGEAPQRYIVKAAAASSTASTAL